MMADKALLVQLQKTVALLGELVVEQRKTNELLTALTQQGQLPRPNGPAGGQAASNAGPVSWGRQG